MREIRVGNITLGIFESAVLLALISIPLFILAQNNYLLFHTIVEGFSIVVSALIYILAARTYVYSQDDLLLFLGQAFAAIAIIDFFHMISYHGLNIIPGTGTNIATQLWISGRYWEAGALLIAPVWIKKKLPRDLSLGIMTATTAFLLWLILQTNWFPTCYVIGVGLTPFKIASEYIICIMILGAMLFLRSHKDNTEPGIYKMLMLSMGLTIIAELSFTLYQDVYGLFNFLGHLFKVGSFILIYRGIVLRGIDQPFDTIFYKLQEALAQVKKRTSELDRQMNVARRIQANSLPSGDEIDGVKIGVFYQPLWQVGGDFCSIITPDQSLSPCALCHNECDEQSKCLPTSTEKYGVVIGDVVGKGPSAALIMSDIVASTRLLGLGEQSPASLLKRLNEALCSKDTVEVPYLATASYMDIDLATKQIRFSNAGHEPAIFYHYASKSAQYLDTQGLMLGVDPVAVSYENIQVAVEPKDKIILYTDGVSQLQDKKGNQFGRDTLTQIVTAHGNESPQQLVQRIRNRINQHQDEQEYYDDCLVVIFEF